MKRAEQAQVEAAAGVLRQILEQVDAGLLDAGAETCRRLEGALLALEVLTDHAEYHRVRWGG